MMKVRHLFSISIRFNDFDFGSCGTYLNDLSLSVFTMTFDFQFVRYVSTFVESDCKFTVSKNEKMKWNERSEKYLYFVSSSSAFFSVKVILITVHELSFIRRFHRDHPYTYQWNAHVAFSQRDRMYTYLKCVLWVSNRYIIIWIASTYIALFVFFRLTSFSNTCPLISVTSVVCVCVFL